MENMFLTQTTSNDYENLCRIDVRGLEDRPCVDSPSPFLLGGVIQHHLTTARSEHPKQAEEIECSLYVDDILSGGQTVEEVKELKRATTSIFERASLKLHKWNSNVDSLDEEFPDEKTSLSHAKEQLGVKSGETTQLGFKWNKEKKTIGVTFPQNESIPSKRARNPE